MLTDPESAQRFGHASLAALEEPVRRYFTHAIRDGARVAAGIGLTMVGRIKLGPVWLAFTAHQEFDGHEFSWRARTGLAAA